MNPWIANIDEHMGTMGNDRTLFPIFITVDKFCVEKIIRPIRIIKYDTQAARGV